MIFFHKICCLFLSGQSSFSTKAGDKLKKVNQKSFLFEIKILWLDQNQQTSLGIVVMELVAESMFVSWAIRNSYHFTELDPEFVKLSTPIPRVTTFLVPGKTRVMWNVR